ncbi:MAG: ABC transporter substrate-binding protein [Candidatus Fermentibacteria bacterium]|nr:ABC transporter substrate-binding protein [Candidatus Fermentibacteria bacterium]
MALLLTGACGSGADPSGDKVQVVFWHAMGGPLGDVLEDSLIAEFNSMHDNIEILPVCMGNYSALSQKIMAGVMADSPPGMAQAYETWTAQLIRGGALVPLDSLMETDSSYTDEMWDDFFPVFQANNTFDGRVYSFPFNKSVPLIYYNVELFDSLGVSPSTTWEEQRELLEILTFDSNGDGDLFDQGDRSGTAFGTSVWSFECLLAQAGGSLLNSDSTETAFNSPEGIEALEYMTTLLYVDSTAYLTSGYDHQKGFAEGRVGQVQGSVTSLAFMIRDMERREESGLSTFTIGTAPLPAGRQQAVYISGTNVILFENEDPRVVEAGWEFIKWFAQPDIQARWFAGSGYLPARVSSLEEPAVIAKMEEYPGLGAVLEQLHYAVFEPKITAWYDGRAFLSESVEIVLYGRMTPEDALSRAAELADAEIRTGR